MDRAGIGDSTLFESEHADRLDLELLLGFRATHAVDVIAMANGPVGHALTAMLTAALMDIIGGVVYIELPMEQASIVKSLPGLIAPDRRTGACGLRQELLRSWVTHPDFRLLK
ncbi:DUF6368 family protein [Streptomyces sp. H27-C3]|uniref:DUF6368 family protein n=1 Tax=Streptomyces sp. H27-C3 TaxID=3046305 RepID=UPI0024B8A2DC|nr:DUF6368 family protein [Streptomyces sp. H27-C3]MDJ0466792.1 DUF6368 family protein [Streptomyces sp. H27-C3]